MILIKYLPVCFSSDIVHTILLMLRENIPLINWSHPSGDSSLSYYLSCLNEHILLFAL